MHPVTKCTDADAHEVTLYAPVDGLNLKGNLSFHQASIGSPVTISVHLSFARQTKQNADGVKLEW